MKRFNRFCDKLSVCSPFPVSENTLCYFAVHLAKDNLLSQTIKTYLVAVRSTQIALGLPDPRDQASLLERIQAGICRIQAARGKAPRTRLPITPKILERLRSHWAGTQPKDHHALWAVASTCFFGFFRLGELLNPGKELRWEDISFDHTCKPMVMRVHLATSKCDQFGRGAHVFLGQAFMYFPYKIHKVPIAVRPEVSGINSPTHNLSKYLDYFYKQLVPKIRS